MVPKVGQVTVIAAVSVRPESVKAWVELDGPVR